MWRSSKFPPEVALFVAAMGLDMADQLRDGPGIRSACSALLSVRVSAPAPRYSIDALRSIGPVGHRHINFRGAASTDSRLSATVPRNPTDSGVTHHLIDQRRH